MSAPTPVREPAHKVQPEAPTAAGPSPDLSAGRVVLGALLMVFGVLWLLDAAGVTELRWRIVLPAALLVVGLALVGTARRASHGGLITTGIVLSVLVLASSVAPMTTPMSGVGDRVERPVELTGAGAAYELGMGTLTVDLRDLTDLSEGAEISASVGMGELSVRLPDGVGAQVRATSGAGEVNILGTTRNGVGVSASETVEGQPMIVLDLSVGMGKVEVRR